MVKTMLEMCSDRCKVIPGVENEIRIVAKRRSFIVKMERSGAEREKEGAEFLI